MINVTFPFYFLDLKFICIGCTTTQEVICNGSKLPSNVVFDPLLILF
jgi:hypothetical protein